MISFLCLFQLGTHQIHQLHFLRVQRKDMIAIFGVQVKQGVFVHKQNGFFVSHGQQFGDNLFHEFDKQVGGSLAMMKGQGDIFGTTQNIEKDMFQYFGAFFDRFVRHLFVFHLFRKLGMNLLKVTPNTGRTQGQLGTVIGGIIQ